MQMHTHRNLFAGFILLLGIFLTSLGYHFVYRYQAGKIEKNFVANANIYAANIEQELNYEVSAVFSLQAFFKAGGVPSRDAFKTFAHQLIENHHAIKALAWIPRIPENERDIYVQNARQYFPSFQILDLNSSGEMVPSPSRPVYYPVYYIEPIKGNEKTLGFDYFSNEKRRQLFEQARDKGEALFTEPIVLEYEKEEAQGYLIYASLYDLPDTLEERRHNFLGFVVGTFTFQDLINVFEINETKDLNVTLYGVDPLVGERFLYSTQEDRKQERNPTGLSHKQHIKVAEETWTLIFTPKPGLYEVKASIQDWILLTIVLFLFSVSSVYIWFIFRYAEENAQLAAKFTTLLEASPNAQVLIDNKNLIILSNEKTEDLLGYSRSDLIHQPYTKLLTKASHEEILKMPSSQQGKIKQFKLFARKKDGAEIPIELEISPLIQADKEVLFICTLIDLQELHSLEKNLEDAVHYDQLTKLPTRNYFEKILQERLTSCKKNNQHLFIFFIGLDQFRALNNSLGSAIGDIMLQSIAVRMRYFASQEDTIARVSGDEFILITTNPKNIYEARFFAQQLLQLFESPLKIAQHEIKLSASIGIACYPKDSDDVEGLIKKANLIMNHVKNEGGNNFGIFHPGMETTYQYKFELETALDFALERKEFYLEYQPIVDIRSQKIIGTEALLRWNHPKLGRISPLEFIPFIEHKPLIKDIGEWVFKTACLQNKSWTKKHGKLYISINISPRQLQDKKHLHHLIHFCEENEISRDTVVLEITESMIMHGYKKSEALLKELAKKGFSISIDDFGTKYSSLERLTTLPISYLKIDKSFIDGIGVNKATEQVIKSILTLADNLKLQVVAEGVETKEQVDFLIKNNCRYIQGYYFSKPLPPKDISTLLQKQPLKTKLK